MSNFQIVDVELQAWRFLKLSFGCSDRNAEQFYGQSIGHSIWNQTSSFLADDGEVSSHTNYG